MVAQILAEERPEVPIPLDHRNAYELLAAVILSAQCTDARVNTVTPALFARYPTPADLAAADQTDVEEIIHSTGFFRAKAQSLIGEFENYLKILKSVRGWDVHHMLVW